MTEVGLEQPATAAINCFSARILMKFHVKLWTLQSRVTITGIVYCALPMVVNDERLNDTRSYLKWMQKTPIFHLQA